MPRLTWDEVATRFFEVGITRGVVYVMKDIINEDDVSDYNYGVSWNGLISVDVSHEGFEATNFGNDGEIYATLRTPETISGTIEAYSYPIQFKPCDGVNVASNGVYISQQDRIPFGLCFRTEIGNDVDNPGDAGYIIHVLYGCIISPASTNYESTNPCEYSWEFSTDPSKIKGYSPFSEVLFDSRYIPSENMQAIEDTLYGTNSSEPTLPKVEALLKLVDSGEFVPYSSISIDPLSINQNGIYSAPTGHAYSPVSVSIPQTSIDAFTITENGTYSAPTGHAYSPVTVSVPSQGHEVNDCFVEGKNVDLYCPDITVVNSYMMYGASGIRSLDFPNCSRIGSNAFYSCSSLTTISFPVCSRIESVVFKDCISLTEAVFPSCNSIGDYAFQNCTSLIEASFPIYGYATLPRCVFKDCRNLENLYFQYSKVDTIYPSAFDGCTKLNFTSAIFTGCRWVFEYAFRNCSSLTEAIFPSCAVSYTHLTLPTILRV